MPRTLRVAALYVVGAALAVGLGGLLSLLPADLRTNSAVRIACVVAATGVALFFAGRAWRYTDETAREAHKVAAFWGTSFGLLAGFLGLGFAVIALVPAQLAQKQMFALMQGHQWTDQLVPMMHGAAIVVLVGVIGYCIAWAGWWLRKASATD